MTRLSERLRAIAEGQEPVRKAAFDEFCPAERSIDELLQGIADRIEEEAADGTGPSQDGTCPSQDGTCPDAAAVEEEWLAWAAETGRLLGVDVHGLTSEELQSAVGDAAIKAGHGVSRLHMMEADWDAVGKALGVMPSAYPTEGGWHVACLDALWRTVEGLLPVEPVELVAQPAWWPCWSDGVPIGPGDRYDGKAVWRVVVGADGWKLMDAGKRTLASGAPGVAVERPDSWDAIVGDLHARQLPEADTQALLDLLDRVRRLA